MDMPKTVNIGGHVEVVFLEHINDACDLSLSHEQISVLETMLYQVLVDNKLLFGREGEE